jgi:nucleotide-binding universal stress UspA family protein
MKATKMRIVCGTDFSVHAAQAADVAAGLAMRRDETLVLIHVVENSGLGAVSSKVFDELLGTIRLRLHNEAERLRKLGATVEEELITGSPYEALVEAGRRVGTRLLVVSSLGRIAPSRLLVGSVAERTAENSPVPTLVVRDSAPFQAWARGERPLKIFLGYDFSTTSDTALRWVNTLRKIGPCDIAVGYVSWPPHENWRLGIGGHTWPEDAPLEIQQLLERDLKEKVRDLLGEENVTIRVEAGWGRPDLQLIESAGAEKADLIVVGTHQRHGVNRLFLGSVSRGILHHAPMSVAVVPMPKTSDQEPPRIPEFRRVLVTTDFSDLGNRAIPYAYSALRRGGTVCLLHVVEPKKQKGPLKQRNDAGAKLRLLIPADAEALGIETRVEIVESREPSQAICQAAERFGADLICMASHGRSGLSKAILGSVAHDVMTCSKRPLLVVRPPGD